MRTRMSVEHRAFRPKDDPRRYTVWKLEPVKGQNYERLHGYMEVGVDDGIPYIIETHDLNPAEILHGMRKLNRKYFPHLL